MKIKLITLTLLVNICGFAYSQGFFVNLDFEDATIQDLTFNQIPATNAFPGWTVNALYVFYDDISLSGASISIMDTNPPSSFAPIQGKYYAWLFGADPNVYGSNYSISLGQAGTIPLSAKSIIFWGSDQGLQITFNGQLLAFSEIGSTADYNIYTADISAYAGQTGQLLFTALPNAYGMIDNIQFSSTAVPEPSVLGLSLLSGLLLAWWHWRKPCSS